MFVLQGTSGLEKTPCKRLIFCLKTYLQFYIYNRLPTDLKKSTIASTIGSSLFAWKITFCQASLWNSFSWLYILPSTNLSGEVISYYQSLCLDPSKQHRPYAKLHGGGFPRTIKAQVPKTFTFRNSKIHLLGTKKKTGSQKTNRTLPFFRQKMVKEGEMLFRVPFIPELLSGKMNETMSLKIMYPLEKKVSKFYSWLLLLFPYACSWSTARMMRIWGK